MLGSLRDRRVRLGLWVAVAVVCAAPGWSETYHQRVLLDLDVEAGTGCAIGVDESGYVGGPFPGVEQVLTLVVSADVQLPTVTGVFRQVCHGAQLGEPVWISGGAWPVGSDGGLAGSDLAEAAVPLASLGTPPRIRLAFSSGTPSQREDVLQTTDGQSDGSAIVVDLAAALPASSPAAQVALGLTLGLVTYAMLRRRRTLPAALALAVAVACVAAAVAHAATVVLDGEPGDWGAARVAADLTGDGLGGEAGDLVAGYVTSDQQNLYVRIDLANVEPACSTGVDADLDGANECDDCDDLDGSVFPGASERCNGLDDDCDRLVDEDFDADLDGFSDCDPDPLRRDCDDSTAARSPAAGESCGAGSGNGLDDDCDGYVDEGCAGCDPTDPDGDGFTGCDGDCDPNEPTVRPGAPELCDGLDNDCNAGTTANCAIGETCNWPGDADRCGDEAVCVCVPDGSGGCSGSYACSGFCNTSETGAVGDGCGSTQTCPIRLLRSADVQACEEAPVAPGATQAGLVCSGDADCRSLQCVQIGPGPSGKLCWDHCASDLYCPAAGTVCRPLRAANLDASCWPSSGLGSATVGDACATDADCDRGLCSQSTGTCSAACCTDGDCPSGDSCSLQGDYVASSFFYTEPDATFCTQDGDCTSGLCNLNDNACAHRLVDTVGQCVADVSGQAARVAGAACSQNADCRSQFCDAVLGVCVDPCCNDSSCPAGLGCALQVVEVRDPSATGESLVTNARICVSQPREAVWRRK